MRSWFEDEAARVVGGTFLATIAAVFLLYAIVGAEPPKVERVKIPVKPLNLEICAAYVSMGAPRDVQWSCKDASEVREWILKNGRPADECSE